MIRLIIKLAGLACLITNLFYIYLIFDQISLKDEKFLSLNKCPFCYGISLCNELQLDKFNKLNHDKYKKYDFNFNDEDSLSNTYFLQWLLNIKNVFYIKDNYSNKKLVMKKLAHSSELAEFDSNEIICSNKCLNKLVSANKKIFKYKFSFESFKKFTEYFEIESTLCFSERFLNILYEDYNEIDGKNYFYPNIYLLTTLILNPEPIFLQVGSLLNCFI